MKHPLARKLLSVVSVPGAVASRAPGRGAASPPEPDAGSLLSALPVPVVLVDAEGRVGFANPAAEEFFGL